MSLLTDAEKLAIVAALLLIAWVYYLLSAQPERSVIGNVNLPVTSNFVPIGATGAASRTLHIKTTKSIPAGSSLDVDMDSAGVLSVRPDQKSALDAAGVSAGVTVNREFIHVHRDTLPPDDFGTFLAYRAGQRRFTSDALSRDNSVVFGLRYSPCRLLLGTVAPDILLAPHAIGVGASAYAPPDLWGPRWSHWGLGVGKLWGVDGSGASTIAYLSFSTYSP